MGVAFFDLRVRASRGNTRVLRSLREYQKKRVYALMGQVVYRAASFVRGEILQRVNGTDLEAPYRRGLLVQQVEGLGRSRGVGYALSIDPKAEQIVSATAKKTILTVRARSSVLVPAKPEVMILQNHGPWTPETLPFQPEPRFAVVTYRSVPEREAKAVADKQKDSAQKKKLSVLFAKVGFRPSPPTDRLLTPATVTAVPDVAYMGIRMELGLGGTEKVPHWRPALAALRATGIRSILKRRDFRDAVGKMRSTGWKKWPPRSADGVSRQTVRLFKPLARRFK